MNPITAADIREHIPEHLRGIIHIDTRESPFGEPPATFITLEVRFATHYPINDQLFERIPREELLPATVAVMIGKLDEVIRTWPGVRP